LLRCHVCLVSFWGPGNWTLYAHSVSLTLPFIDRSDWTWGGTHRVRAHKMSLKWRKKKPVWSHSRWGGHHFTSGRN
jgi:hypothetical protein